MEILDIDTKSLANMQPFSRSELVDSAGLNVSDTEGDFLQIFDDIRAPVNVNCRNDFLFPKDYVSLQKSTSGASCESVMLYGYNEAYEFVACDTSFLILAEICEKCFFGVKQGDGRVFKISFELDVCTTEGDSLIKAVLNELDFGKKH